MPQATPKIAILPSNMKLGAQPGAISLERLIWPLGTPQEISGKCLRDLGADDHLIVFPRTTLHFRPFWGIRARISIMVMEPPAIHGHHLRRLRWSYRRFFRVLTCNEGLLAAIPNGIFFAHGSTWVPEWRTLDLTKTRMTSLIASAKRSQEGHALRHSVAAWASAEGLDVDTMGGGYVPFGAKAEGLAPYRYSIVIENVRERNYFTEKLLDAVLCQTVPIYWGCPNIADFIDTSGMIICESQEDIRRAVLDVSETQYEALRPGLIAAQGQADGWADYMGRAARAVLDSA
ncbi:MAG: glycosyltransferase family 10 [Roseovarius sp.]|nr:glycosyltransferase family 10 [Roseovarius sp.]